MQPVDLSTIAQNLGPGTGGLWLGEQQKNAMQESELNQQNTLEQIAASRQNRDIQSQKTPLELERMRGENSLYPGKLTEQQDIHKEREAKISKEKYNDLLQGLGQMDPQFVPMDQRAGYLNELSKRTGIPADHPMFEMALRAHAAGPEAFKKFQSAVDPKLMAEREKTASNEGIHAASNTTQVAVAEIGANKAMEVQRLKNEALAAKANEVKMTTDQLIAKYTDEMMKETDPARKQQLNAYIQYLQQGKMAIAQAQGQGKTDELERTLQMFQQGAQMQAPPPKQVTPGTLPNPPMGGPAQAGAPPMPQGAPPQGGMPPQGQPQAAPPQQGGPAPGTKAKTRDGRDVQWDGKGWVLIQG